MDMTGRLMHLCWSRILLLTAGLCATGTSLSMDAVLSPAEIQQAVQSGKSMVSPNNGYIAKPYVLHEYNSGIRIDPDSPVVDALTVATPYERVRYYSYLEAYQSKPVSQSAAQPKSPRTTRIG